MQKVVDVCKRVEGHGNVKLFIQNDEISNVEFEILAFRGFENILIGKQLSDVPRIISRICGLCHASQTIVSCKSIENMYNIKANHQSVLIRRILMAGELLKSHSLHYFFQSFPDLLNIFNISTKIPDIYNLVKFNPQLTSHIYDIIKIGNDIDQLYGGRSIHTITSIPGGVIYRPSRKRKNIAQKYFLKVISNLEWIIENFIDLFSKFPPPEDYKLPDIKFFSLNNNRSYDRYNGILTIKKGATKYQDFKLEEYPNYFDKDSTIWGIDLVDKNQNYLVGPISRNQIVESYGSDEISGFLNFFDKEWRKNILFANILRLIEMFVESQNSLNILEEPILNTTLPFPNLNSINTQEGIAVVEAPRGTLIHHYRINKRNVIEEAKLFIATEINIPLINEMITNYARKLYNKTGDINMVKKEVQKIIRAFDPCISCASH
ncbi:MAG: nickel-dependent hydrogenase large subunit [Promethearchaeota archaeon]